MKNEPKKKSFQKSETQLKAPTSKCLKNAFQILEYAYESTDALWKTFSAVKKKRNTRGVPTHAEQDLLRATLIFACAGLDSFIKQVIRDAFENLIEIHDKAAIALQKYAERRLGKSIVNDSETFTFDPKVLASVLMHKSPRKGLVSLLIEDVTSSSIQSHEEIMKVVNYLGVDPLKLSIQPEEIKQIFSARNRIIHEMDIDFGAWKKRRQHKIKETENRYKRILALGVGILKEVDDILLQKTIDKDSQ